MEEKTGKTDFDFFKKFILDKSGSNRPEVTTGPAFGTDVAIIDLPHGMAMAVASDPVTLIPSLGLEESAWLTVHLTANDIATTGFTPMYGQFILNLPVHFSRKDFEIYWKHIHQFCKDIDLAITGGHTGFIEGQNSTTPGGATFFTLGESQKILTSACAKPGDIILVTKSCALSAAAILAMSFPETVKNKAGQAHYQNACESFYEISVLKEALIAVQNHTGGITAMHDVTEGGVLGAIYELAIASGNGAVIYDDQLPVQETQSVICRIFSLDPRRCLGAGSMIITCRKEVAGKVINRLQYANIECALAGEITSGTEGIRLRKDELNEPVIYADRDPYWAAFFKAIKAGWK